jgi:hypothetical protein
VKLPVTLCIVLFTALSIPRVSPAQFDELVTKLPSSANAVAFINAEKLLESPVAKRENWAGQRHAAFDSGASFLPPDSDQAVLAMQLDLSLDLPLWQLAVLEVDHQPSMESVASFTGGEIDKVADLPAVSLPGDGYVLKFDDKHVAFMSPANRQSVVRWLREVMTRKDAQFSPYLTEAYRFANNDGTPVILAIDLEDAVDAQTAIEWLKQPEAMQVLDEHQLAPTEVAGLLANIRGATLGVTFGEKAFGKIKVDFTSEVKLTPAAAKAILLLAVANFGATIDEFHSWKAGVTARQITLEGYLEPSGIKRIASIFDRPPSLRQKQPNSGDTEATKEQLTALASQQYFKRVNELLEDAKPGQDYTLPQIGCWLNKYASKIDQLSVLNVDPELVAYGSQVSDMLRQAYDSIRGGSARARTRQVSVPISDYSAGTYYGYNYRNEYRHERSKIRTEERVASGYDARTIVQDIQRLTAEVRKKMTVKYQRDF